MSDSSKTFAIAAAFGFIAGMRSMAAPAFLSHYLSRRAPFRRGGATRFLGSRGTSTVLKMLAAGEMVADKTPFVPDRIELPAVSGRAISGALCGYVVSDLRGGSRLGGALTGSAAAICSTFVAYNARKAAGTSCGVPDPLLGVAEDMVVLSAGSRLIGVMGDR